VEHKAGLRARFVRNSIGGGSHDPRNWIGCVSRREETTTARPAMRRSHGKEGKKEGRSYRNRRYGSRACIDRRIIGSCRSRMTNRRLAKVDESANIGLPLSAASFATRRVSPCSSLKRTGSATRATPSPRDRDRLTGLSTRDLTP
jgi:hypothetical protein